LKQQDRKKAQYLSADIERKGFNCENRLLEVGVKGYISPTNRETLFYIALISNVKRTMNL
jgi:hypothetical protein